MTASQQTPSPLRIFTTFNAYQQTAALRAACELDVFTAIGEGNTDVGALAKRCGASERGTRILCDYLTIIGLLEKQNGRYALAADSALFLDRRSPACFASATSFLTSPTLTSGYADLAAAVRKGGVANTDEGTIAPDHPVWVDFARSMAPLMAPLAGYMAGLAGADGRMVRRVLDIAAGHGLFGIAVAQAHQDAHVVAVDWANVLTVAVENAERAGVASRYSTIPGSAFEVDFGTGYDVVLLTNFLHHFDPATCEKLLRKIRGSMVSGGIILTAEFVPNEDRVTPPAAAAFSMMMLGSTPAGDAYTLAEFDRMFRNAGFGASTLYSPEGPEQVIVTKAE